MFERIENIEESVILLNKCDGLDRVLELFLKSTCLMVSHNEDLTHDEKSKFAAAFGLQEDQMDIIVSFIDSILNECVYYVAKPTLVMKVSFFTLEYSSKH